MLAGMLLRVCGRFRGMESMCKRGKGQVQGVEGGMNSM